MTTVNGDIEGSIAERYTWLIEDELAGIRREAELFQGGPDRAATVSRQTFVSSAGPALSWLQWGREPVRSVFLHGAGLNAHSWDAVQLRLRGASAALDLPGHGASDWHADFDYRPARVASSIAPFLDAQPERQVVLVGQSLGGLAAIELAAANPERIAALVVVDITPGRRPASAGSDRIREFVNSRSSFASYEEVVDHALASGLSRDRTSLEPGVVLNTRVRGDGRIVFAHHFGSPPPGQLPLAADITYLWSRLEAIDPHRILLVRGSEGIVDVDQAAEFRTRLPGAAVVEMAAGHNVQRDAPAELARAIAGFSGIS